jgi:hypothetical protein
VPSRDSDRENITSVCSLSTLAVPAGLITLHFINLGSNTTLPLFERTPVLNNPFLPMPSAASAWSEGFIKGLAAISSPEPGDDIGLEDIDAFNQGVAAGEESTRTGIDLGGNCIPASEEHGPLHGTEVTIGAGHILHGVWEGRHLAKLAAGMAGIVAGLVELAIALPVHTLPPEQVLPEIAQPMIDALVSFGVESMELFIGAGLDPTEAAADCEIRVTPIFVSFDQAREAAVAMNRFQWVVASWRTDQSNSFRVVDDGGRD